MPNFWRTISHCRIFLKKIPLSMLILGQKSCILGPTIFKFSTNELTLLYTHCTVTANRYVFLLNFPSLSSYLSNQRFTKNLQNGSHETCLIRSKKHLVKKHGNISKNAISELILTHCDSFTRLEPSTHC